MSELDLQIAQLFLAAVPGPSLTPEWHRGLEQFPFGGVHISNHNVQGPGQAAELIEQIQRAIARRGVTQTPLFALDHEGGTMSPLQNGEATVLPGNMALSATADPRAALAVGRIMGRELASLGFNLNWAPVVDVNVNPKNPVIGVRSFGDHPRRVAEMALPLIQGMQEGGVAATAKHFPGHGDTTVDSHLGLPVIGDDLTRLEAVHLPPFAAAVAAGVDAVMTAHILFPGLAGSVLDPDGKYAGIPATLNPVILDRLLRRHLGFDGVIVTDALEMWGIAGRWDVAEAAVLALEAGADIPLVVLDEESRRRAFAAVREAVKGGRISRERLSQSVARIDRLREKVAARRAAAGFLGRFDPIVHEAMLAEHRAQVAALAPKAVTLVRDPAGLLPLQPGARLVVVAPRSEMQTPADTSGAQSGTLAAELASRGYAVQAVAISAEADLQERATAVAAAEAADVVVMATLNAWRYEGQVQLLSDLAATGRPLVAAVVRDPADLPLIPAGAAVLATASFQPVMMAGLAAVLAGGARAGGRLPVTI